MRSYKLFDLWSQVMLALVIITGYLADRSGAVAGVSIIAYAVLQLISLAVHLFNGTRPWKEQRLRKIHLAGVGIILLIMLYGLVKPPADKYDMSGLGIIIYALIPGAAAAFFYTVITFLEWKKIKNRS